MLNAAQALAWATLMPVLEGHDDAPQLAVLEGYAGTGKSYLVAAMLAELSPRMRIAVAAPTNKAVRVLKTLLNEQGVSTNDTGEHFYFGCDLKSVHAFLGLKLRELENGMQETSREGRATIRNYDVMIVDESSMLSSSLFDSIIQERGACRILFVGDPAQLPPVNERSGVSPVFDRVRLKVRLSEVVRQAASNPIIRLSIKIRELIEANVKADLMTLAQVTPAPAPGVTLAILPGSPIDLVHLFLDERQHAPENDTRIIAYTNARVIHYNRAVHHALHAQCATSFAVGEPVIVQSQCMAQSDSGEVPLITSEELTVVRIEPDMHPYFPDMPSERIWLQNNKGLIVSGYVPANQTLFDNAVNGYFAIWRELKAQAEKEFNQTEKAGLKSRSVSASHAGWALRNAFLPLRHAYAITAHKSQGSSFDCALVDFTDLARMRDPFEFNRALYVAVTRSREFLALMAT